MEKRRQHQDNTLQKWGGAGESAFVQVSTTQTYKFCYLTSSKIKDSTNECRKFKM